MKLLFLVRKFPPKFLGGAEINTLILAKALAKRGHKVLVLTGGPEGEEKRDGFSVKYIPELAFSPRLGTLLLPFYSWRLRKKIKKEIDWADIVHAFDYESILLLVGYQEIQPKLVATIQDYLLISTGEAELDANFWQKTYLKLVSPLRLFYRQRKLKGLNRIIFVSKFLAKKFNLAENVYSESIYYPLSLDWKRIESQKEETTDILYLGRLAEYKGLGILLQAINRVVKIRPVSVKIIGEGNVDLWKQKAKSFGIKQKIRFLGKASYDKVKEEILRSKLIIVPSLWPEPSARVVIEGMSLGKAVIGTKCGGTPELIKNGETGFLVKAEDSKGLAKKIITVLEDDNLRQKIGLAAKKEAWKRFDPILIAKKHEGFYHQVLQGTKV